MRQAARWWLASLFFLAACSPSAPKGDGGTGPTSQDIPPASAAAMASSFATLAPQLASRSATHALALEAGALALLAGAKATPLSVTAALLGPAERSPALVSGSWSAVGLELTVLNAPGVSGSLILSGALLLRSSTDAVLAIGPAAASPIPPGVGVLVSGSNAWIATAGSVSATLVNETGPCPQIAGLPVEVTSCRLATFDSAGFSITASAPAAGSATGSRTASVPLSSVVGASITIDCSRGTLCATVINTPKALTVGPNPVTLRPGNRQQFTAFINGIRSTAVSWTATGGTIDAGGLYTAGSTTGSFTVTATSTADSTKSARADVTIAPSTMTVTATALAPTVIGVSWTAVPGATSYVITRFELGSPFGLPGTTGLTYRDPGLLPRATYRYQVDAVGTSTIIDTATSASVTTPATGGTIVFQDGDFKPVDWADGKSEGSDVASTAVSAQVATGGVPGAYRTSDLHLKGTSLAQWNKKIAAVHVPSTQGRIVSVDFDFDLNPISGGNLRFDVYIEQAGRRYYSDARVVPSVAGWARYSFRDVLAQDLLELNGSTVPADFSGSTPLTFGYIAAVSSPQAIDVERVVGIDNWKVTIHLAP